jgi:hypothetical protein
MPLLLFAWTQISDSWPGVWGQIQWVDKADGVPAQGSLLLVITCQGYNSSKLRSVKAAT